MDYSLWFALLVPSATPPEIVKKLNADIGKVVADPDHQQAMKLRGFEAEAALRTNWRHSCKRITSKTGN